MLLKPGMQSIDAGEVLLDDAMRGSVSYVARSGGGHGCMTSQVIGTRLAGSWASSSCRIVVPVRGRPTMKSGERMSTAAISGWWLTTSVMWSRFCSKPDDVGPRDRPAERGELRLGLERVEQDAQWLAEERVAEIRQPGEPPRPVEQRWRIEADDGKAGGAQCGAGAIEQAQAKRPGDLQLRHRSPEIHHKDTQNTKKRRVSAGGGGRRQWHSNTCAPLMLRPGPLLARTVGALAAT